MNSINGFRMSPQQKHLWGLMTNTEGQPYFIQIAVNLTGKLDEDRLQIAFQKTIAQHEILRTSFQTPAGMTLPVQIIHPEETALPKITTHHWGQLSAAAQAQKYASTFDDVSPPFNFSQPVPLAIDLIARADNQYTLIIRAPSLAMDARAAQLVVRTLAQSYASPDGGSTSTGDEEDFQYADIAEWLNEMLEAGKDENQNEFWYHQLVQAPLEVALPSEEKAARDQFTPRALPIPLSLETVTAVGDAANQRGVSPDAIYLACWQTLLARLTAQEKIVIGLGCHGRTYEELETAPGLFHKNLPYATDYDGMQSFANLLTDVARSIDEFFDAQEYFSWDVLNLTGATDEGLPYFPFAFDSRKLSEPLAAGDVDFQIASLTSTTTRFHIQLLCDQHGASLRFDSTRYTRADVEKIAEWFANLLVGCLHAPDQALGAHPLLSDVEQRDLLASFEAVPLATPPATTIDAWIAQQASQSPNAVAVRYQGQSISYQTLNAQSNQLARRIQKIGVPRGAFIGLYMQNSVSLLTGILGIIKAGCAYLPLDPDYPAERINFMLADTQTQLVLTLEDVRTQLCDLAPAEIDTLALDSDWAQIAPADASPPEPTHTDDDPAYVIYTSGSTGKPKGVVVSHRNLVHSTFARMQYYEAPPTRYLLLSSFGFDSSVAGIFWTLCSGGALVLPESGMTRDGQYTAGLLQSEGVTHTLGLPTFWDALLDGLPNVDTDLQVVIVAGEACPATLVDKHRTQLPAVRLFNEYGPTEGTVWATVFDCAQTHGARVPIGRAIPGGVSYILDAHKQLVPPGTPGELYIGGAGVVRGYLNRPEQTAQRFIANRFGDGRLYQTGDLVRTRTDGNIEFLGRVDHQIKIRGYRVELGEIEALLEQHPTLEKAAVLVHENTPGDKRLTAYLVVRGSEKLSGTDMRAYLAQRLPAYMIPAAFVYLDQFPLTPNGKLDRKALPNPDPSRPNLTEAYVAARTPVEEVLAEIWADVLHVDKVGIQDDFFALGGHSILVTRLVGEIRNTLPAALSLNAVFENPTIAKLAAVLLAPEDTRVAVEQTAAVLRQVAQLSDAEIEAQLTKRDTT